LHYSKADLETAANNFSKFMGSHEVSCRADEFENYLPSIASFHKETTAETENISPFMIRIANEAAREILARGDADVYRLTDKGVIKLDTFEALRPMCFAEYTDLAIKQKDAAGLDKWAERKVDGIIRQAEREERGGIVAYGAR
jgi:hypothetical protein